jgi:hypothetical protein
VTAAYAFPEAAAGYLARQAGRCLARAAAARSFHQERDYLAAAQRLDIEARANLEAWHNDCAERIAARGAK